MFNSIAKSITKLLGGSKSERDVKEVTPYIEKINSFFAGYENISNDELRNKTQEFRNRIDEFITDETNEIAKLKTQAEVEDIDIDQQEELYNEIDAIEKRCSRKLKLSY